MIVTFYSYKGGVGRSMAMANVADVLARRGARVLMIDFDLEVEAVHGDHMTERPLTMAQPSWRSVFEGFGMPAMAAADETALADALAAWAPTQGPAYLEVSFDPDPYEAMVQGIR